MAEPLLRFVQRPPAGASAEAKLAHAEFLIACEEPQSSARRTLEWLAQHAGMRQGVCLTVESGEGRLFGLAALRLSAERLARFSLNLEERKQPLVSALLSRRTIRFGSGEGQTPVPADVPLRPGFLAVPLYGVVGKDNVPAGLLLASPITPVLEREAVWVADLLGHRLVRLSRNHTLSEMESRVRRERTLLDAVSDPILLTDTEGRMLVANKAARGLLEATEEDSEGRRRAVALNNMLLSSTLAHGALQGGLVRRELALADPTEGSDLLFELMGAPIADPREGTAFVSVLRNVTDLRRATEEIQENYRRLRAAETDVRAERDRLSVIIDSVADPILVTDPAGAIMMMNDPAERLFAVPTDASPDVSARVQANDAHFSSFVSNLFFVDEGTRRRDHVGLVDPLTGATLPCEGVSGKILNEHGEVTAVVTILHDRTEELEKAGLYEQLKQASDELEQRVREATSELVRQNELLRRQSIELEQASVAKSQFLANMSHEFRTPLNAIMGYTSLMLQGVSGPLNDQQTSNLGRVDSNARHLMAIINDILDISRIEAGKLPLRLVRFGLPELVGEVLREVEPVIARTHLEVTSELDQRLPPVVSDRAKVKQIVINLLTNALKFTPHGSVQIRAAYERGTRKLNVAVHDTGIGIAAADRERIFEDFSQADSSPARAYGGAGLGLSICRRLANMLGGEISLHSNVGKGSVFTLRLPVKTRR